MTAAGGASEPSVRATYDAVDRAYAALLPDELDHKPLDRASAERARAAFELVRVLGPGGVLLVALPVDSAELPAGSVNHLTEWSAEPVPIDGYFLRPEDVTAGLERAGLVIKAQTPRQPEPAHEYPSRRCYLFAERVVSG